MTRNSRNSKNELIFLFGFEGKLSILLIEFCSQFQTDKYWFVKDLFFYEFRRSLLQKYFDLFSNQKNRSAFFKHNFPVLISLCNNQVLISNTNIALWIHRKSLNIIETNFEENERKNENNQKLLDSIEIICKCILQNNQCPLLLHFLKKNKNEIIESTVLEICQSFLAQKMPQKLTNFEDFSQKLEQLEVLFFLNRKNSSQIIKKMQTELSMISSAFIIANLQWFENLIIQGEILFKELFFTTQCKQNSFDSFSNIHEIISKINNLAHNFCPTKDIDVISQYFAFGNQTSLWNNNELKPIIRSIQKIPIECSYCIFFLFENAILFNRIYVLKFPNMVFLNALLLISIAKEYPESVTFWIISEILIELKYNKNDLILKFMQVLLKRDLFSETSEFHKTSYIEINTIVNVYKALNCSIFQNESNKNQMVNSLNAWIKKIVNELSMKIEKNKVGYSSMCLILDLNLEILKKSNNFVTSTKIFKEILYIQKKLWNSDLKNDLYFNLKKHDSLAFIVQDKGFGNHGNLNQIICGLITPNNLLKSLNSLSVMIKSAFECGAFIAIPVLIENYKTISKNVGIVTRVLDAHSFEHRLTQNNDRTRANVLKMINISKCPFDDSFEEISADIQHLHPIIKRKFWKLFNQTNKSQCGNTVLSTMPSFLKMQEMNYHKHENITYSFKHEYFFNLKKMILQFVKCSKFKKLLNNQNEQSMHFSEHENFHILEILQELIEKICHGLKSFKYLFLENLTIILFENFMNFESSFHAIKITTFCSFLLVFQQLFILAFNSNFVLLAKNCLSIVFTILAEVKTKFQNLEEIGHLLKSSTNLPKCDCKIMEISDFYNFQNCLIRFINHEQMFRFIYNRSFLVENRFSFSYRKSITRFSVNNNMPLTDLKMNSVLSLIFIKDFGFDFIEKSNLKLLEENEHEKKSFFYYLGAFENAKFIENKFLYFGFYDFESSNSNFYDVFDNQKVSVF